LKVRELIKAIMGEPTLTKQDIAVRYAVTVRTVERWMADGTLPRPIRLHGPRWRPADLQKWEDKHE
jgi:predicted DNA-binding transcriptional regulator AlpA